MTHGSKAIDVAWDAVTRATKERPVLRVTGKKGSLRSALPIEDVAVACVSVALMAASASLSRRVGQSVDCMVDRQRVADAVLSERLFTVRGESASMGFAPLSKFWRTTDGWVRTHTNYQWHRSALLSALEVDDAGNAEETQRRLATAMRGLSAQEVEDRVFNHDGIAVRVRSDREWSASQQGISISAEPLVGHRVIPGAPRRRALTEPSPAGGVRVLDLTRVIAGPVCTRYLGALGASVLRLDPPRHLDMEHGQIADTLLGKRSAALDFTTPSGRDKLHDLLDSADVVVCGYRPGSLDRFGLGDDELAERHPGLVVVRLTAWGYTGGWAHRRGFDSIVQAATGIATAEGDGEHPGVLPCQLLDHGTGYLAAAAALEGLNRQQTEGGTQIRSLSLARTSRWLLDTPHATKSISSEVGTTSSSLERLDGDVAAVAPPGHITGSPLRWPCPTSGYLNDDPSWPATEVVSFP